MEKATLDELIRRKMQAEAERNDFKPIDIPEIKLSLVFQKLPSTEIVTLLDDIGNGLNMKENYDKCVQLIYKCCPLLRDSKLHEGLAEPYDVVPLIFNDNINAVVYTAEKVLNEFYGGNVKDQATEKVKN